jgi:drug/metabolite transporter (DMT)-like permease
MIRRRFIFGIVFLVAGVLFLIAASSFDQQLRLVKDSERDGWTEWHFVDPSILAEGTGRTGLISTAVGVVLLASEASKLLRRQLPQ